MGKKIGQIFFIIYLCIVGLWIMFALSFDIYCVYLEVSGQDDKLLEISNNFTERFDGRYKNNPKNIWYNTK
jgi:hypothetical protein